VLGCVESGSESVPTLLLDRLGVKLSREELQLARSAVFHVRNGRGSFYASIVGLDPRFIRYDPGCMHPVSPEALEALALFSNERVAPQSISFHWQPGDLLIIDNWRMLHARGHLTGASIERVLLRSNVK
jgi:hypothetical protein